MAQSMGRPKKRRRLIIAPMVGIEVGDSEADTLPIETPNASLVGDIEMFEEEAMRLNLTAETTEGEEDDDDSMSNLSDPDEDYNEYAPTRTDRDIVRSRWQEEEVDALLEALNCNRDAIKFHFEGPGGGKDIKRQAWRDVAKYVNDVADTHRTINQCRVKSNDYTQRVKQKYNKLRYEISKTGRGKIKKGLHIKQVEEKALDYLREEPIRGIPGIEPIDIGGPEEKKPSKKNIALLWKPDRDSVPLYSEIKMEKLGIPKNYADKNKRRISRVERERRKKETGKEMRAERKKEKVDLKKYKRQVKAKAGKGAKGRRKEEQKVKLKEEISIVSEKHKVTRKKKVQEKKERKLARGKRREEKLKRKEARKGRREARAISKMSK